MSWIVTGSGFSNHPLCNTFLKKFSKNFWVNSLLHRIGFSHHFNIKLIQASEEQASTFVLSVFHLGLTMSSVRWKDKY